MVGSSRKPHKGAKTRLTPHADRRQFLEIKIGLTSQQAGQLKTACLDIPNDWRLCYQKGPEGFLILVLLHQTSDTCFFFAGATEGVSLAMMVGDAFFDHGCFKTMDDAITVLLAIIREQPKTTYLM